MFKFVRRNLIALVALFLALGGTAYAANTVRSSDIVDGTIKTQDLSNKAVTPAKSTGLWTFHYTTTAATSSCVQQAATWTLCGSILLGVPAGHQYTVTAISSVTANPGGITLNGALYCPAFEGPTCLAQPERATFVANSWTSATTSATKTFGPGEHYFGTALDLQTTLPPDQNASTTTTLIVTDSSQNVFG